jgi:hypothetical protein
MESVRLDWPGGLSYYRGALTEIRPIPWLRVVVFMALAVFLVLGPAYRHAWGGRWQGIRAWRMFHGNAIDTCDVRYYQRLDGKDQLLDRYKLLDYPSRSEAPRKVRRLQVRGVNPMARKLCTAVQEQTGVRPDVRIESRCATREGWKSRDRRGTNHCKRSGL